MSSFFIENLQTLNVLESVISESIDRFIRGINKINTERMSEKIITSRLPTQHSFTAAAANSSKALSP